MRPGRPPLAPELKHSEKFALNLRPATVDLLHHEAAKRRTSARELIRALIERHFGSPENTER